jgi:cyclopropane fatty-acyl-phospholipid synthase-like methyltransferase
LKRDFQTAFLRQRGLLPEHYLLDIGCGTLRGGIPVIAYLAPEHYFGLDSRAEVIDEAFKELETAKLEAKRPALLATRSLSSVRLPHRMDVIWAFSVLIHMDDAALGDCFELVASVMRDSGAFYANVNVGPRGELGRWEEFPVVVRPLEDYAARASEAGLRTADLGTLLENGHPNGLGDSQRMLRFSTAA